MPFLEKSAVLSALKLSATNSSHFVWLLADLRFFQTTGGWTFAFQTLSSVTLIALEPLMPEALVRTSPSYLAGAASEFNRAFEEFRAEVKPKLCAFVSIGAPFSQWLRREGFQIVKAGEEPWIDVSECIPTGNSGKGVRSARNHAIRSGLTVEEWNTQDFKEMPERLVTLREIFREWRTSGLINLTGFMNATDPFSFSDERRYFILRSEKRVEAFCVATPVYATGGYFLEDLVMRDGCPNGTGELLTLETMVALANSGCSEASLGVISLTLAEPHAALELPKVIQFLLVQAPRLFHSFYNFNGMATYRKRFNPKAWREIYVGVKNYEPNVSDTQAWLKVLWSLFWAFKPTLQCNPRWILRVLLKPILRYPVSIAALVINFLSFGLINHFGALPAWALNRFGFSGEAPVSEWFTRSVVSDFLYFGPSHFYVWALGYVAVLFWVERSHRTRFALWFAASVCIFDDIINYNLLIRPIAFFQPTLFTDLIHIKDVGGSLGLATLLGLQTCQFKKVREPLFALMTLGLVLAFVFTTPQLKLLILNLNHLVMFTVGFLAGKIKFEYHRHQSRKVSKLKPPPGNTVRKKMSIKRAA